MTPGGIGVLGDSYSDEYIGYAPDRIRARNWVEILAATRSLDFGPYTTVGRGEPRNRGFAYNWARSDATTDDLLVTGQHTGVAEQVATGKVRMVAIFIGGNDFINALKSSQPSAALEATLPRAMANYRTVIQTIRAADPNLKLVLVTLPDVRNLPEFARPLSEGRIPCGLADACTAAIGTYNTQIRCFALNDPRTALLDLDLALQMAKLRGSGFLVVGDRRVQLAEAGNDLDHLFLADLRHPGTLGQGLIGRLFVDTINARFGASVAPLSDTELIGFAASIPVPGPPPRVAAEETPGAPDETTPAGHEALRTDSGENLDRRNDRER